MSILVCLFSIIVLVKSFSFAIYEYKTNKNIAGSIVFSVFTVICFIFINVMLILK